MAGDKSPQPFIFWLYKGTSGHNLPPRSVGVPWPSAKAHGNTSRGNLLTGHGRRPEAWLALLLKAMAGVPSQRDTGVAEEREHGLPLRFWGEPWPLLMGFRYGRNLIVHLDRTQIVQVVGSCRRVSQNAIPQDGEFFHSERRRLSAGDRLIPSQALDLLMRWMGIPMHSPLNPPLPPPT